LQQEFQVSNRAARAVPEAPSFSISLQIKHPSIDPEIITQKLGVTPDHCWACGEPKRSGATTQGVRRNSFWCATLPPPAVNAEFVDLLRESAKLQRAIEHASQDLATALNVRLLLLRRHRDFIQGLIDEGGELSFVVEMPSTDLAGFKMDSSLSRQLGALEATLEFQFVS
jgi:hypothetical protein